MGERGALTGRVLTAAERRLQRSIGVTRIGRVTGLDRAGVEVACAVRPTGHVLQVSNGKGSTFQHAARTALFEAAELWAVEQANPASWVFASREELRRAKGAEVWDAGDLGSAGHLVAPRLWSDRTRISWCRGEDLLSGAAVWIPAQAVYCPPAGAPLLGPCVVEWTSNGMGAHPRRVRALLHALLEAIERDQLARALPEGWTPGRLRSRMLAPRSIDRVAPRAARELARLSEQGFDAWLFDLSAEGSGALRLPVAGALLVDRELGPIALTAGYACRLSAEEALLAALREAAQSRLTDIHGAREDVVSSDPSQALAVRDLCLHVRPSRAPFRRLRPKPAKKQPLAFVVEALRAAGIRRAAVVDVAPSAPDLHVVKVVVPQFKRSELL